MSQTLLFSIICSSLTIAAAGVYVWLRFIRTQPLKAASGEASQKEAEAGVPGGGESLMRAGDRVSPA